MTERELPPLEPWASRAKDWFLGSWGLLIFLNLFEDFGWISRDGFTFWWWASLPFAVVSIPAAVMWAAGAWRRRRRPAKGGAETDDLGAETPPT